MPVIKAYIMAAIENAKNEYQCFGGKEGNCVILDPITAKFIFGVDSKPTTLCGLKVVIRWDKLVLKEPPVKLEDGRCQSKFEPYIRIANIGTELTLCFG